MSILPYQRASELPERSDGLTHWLVEELWSDQAVGILGGEPKSCKSFLGLDLAVSVAAGVPCLRKYPVRNPGRVVVFPAEDTLGIVRKRIAGICAAAGVCFQSLPLDVITVPVLRLDREADRLLLSNTVEALRPRLLVLDPLIRLHRTDENDASQIAELLSFLRELQRRFQVAILLVHHARKDSNGSRPGQALRGSSELHAWGESNLFLRWRGRQLTLTTEHRAAAAKDNIPIQLLVHGPVLSLAVVDSHAGPPAEASAAERVRQALGQLDEPASLSRIRKLCGMRTASVCEGLAALVQQGAAVQDSRGYRLAAKAAT